MKGLYLLSGTMLLGLVIMFVAYYKVLTELGAAKGGAVMQSGVKTYVAINYFGLGLFLLGAFGALFMVLRSFTRRS